MTLQAKAHWKATSDKEVASLKNNNVYTLVPATAVPAGHKIVGSRWVYKVKADKSYKGRSSCSDGDKYQASTGSSCSDGDKYQASLRRHVCSGLQASEHPYGAGDSGGVRL